MKFCWLFLLIALSGHAAAPYVVYVADSANQTVYAINVSSTSTTPIPVTTTIANTTAFPFSQPLSIAVTADGSHSYLTDNGSAEVYSINTLTDTTSSVVSPGSQPSFVNLRQVAFIPNQGSAYVVQGAPTNPGVYVVNTTTNTATAVVLNTFTPFTNPSWVAVNSSTAYITDNGNVYVIDTTMNAVTATVSPSATFNQPFAAALSQTFAYVTDLANQAVYLIDPMLNTVTGSVSVGAFPPFNAPRGVAISPNEQYVYITDNNNNTIYVIDTIMDPLSVYATVSAGSFPAIAGPYGVAFSPDGSSTYVTTTGNGSPGSINVYQIDTASQAVTAMITADLFPAFQNPISVTTGPFPFAPPTNFTGQVITNNFLSQTDIIDLLSWDPSPNALGYRILEGNEVVATIFATEPLTASIHNRKKNMSYTYTLIAFNAAGDTTTPLIITVP